MAWRKKDKLKEMRIDPEVARQAAKAVRGAFIWSASREGGDYWYRVAERLASLSEVKVEGLDEVEEQGLA